MHPHNDIPDSPQSGESRSETPLVGASAMPALPTRGVLMAVDPGSRRLGIAVSDADQRVAMPLTTLNVITPQHCAQQVKRLVADYGPVGWVVGLPLRVDGQEGTQAARARAWAAWLQQTTRLPVILWDERYSTSEAAVRVMSYGGLPDKKSGRLDTLAAQVILESYLTHRSARAESERHNSARPVDVPTDLHIEPSAWNLTSPIPSEHPDVR
ncbi:MAG: hypothetical protein KatS3mg113_1035 [Planctomycetaceae bacterium]|nr:MAG: hypothetical protein KatS3mg113_1035 [Planctomycetaceae bacterium]